MVNQTTENFKFLKKTLVNPEKFKKEAYYVDNKACFSYNYKQYGSLKTWDLAWEKLKELPPCENIFHELILQDFKVKPYLDIEWYAESNPDLIPEKVLAHIKELIIKIFEEEWGFELKNEDIYVASCHRKTQQDYKYSFRIVISTHNPMIVFNNTNSASYLANAIKERCTDLFDKDIIDSSVYKKTQNIRLINHCKHGEFIAMQKMNSSDDDKDFIITNLDTLHSILEVPEQIDSIYKTIKYNDLENPELVYFILEKIKDYHKTAYIESVNNGFIQLNYHDKTEPCFSDGKRTHERIGFFCYSFNDLVFIGCHSGNCVNEDNKKIVINIGSFENSSNSDYEAVSYENEFDIDSSYVKKCINNNNIGMSDLFSKMYLNPKRIKWINDTNTGSVFYWDGDLWKHDEFFYLDNLIPRSLVKVLKKFKENYIDFSQNQENITVDNDNATIKNCNKMIMKLNEGTNIKNIIKFLKTKMHDPAFEQIKDITPYLLSCKNGVIELKTGELRKRIPEDNITKCIDVEYDENSDYSEFDNFVREITSSEEGPDKDLYNYLRWSVGYAIQGRPVKKLFFIFYGKKGYNGKSLFLNTIRNVLNFYAVTMDKSVVVEGPQKTSGSHSTELCQLENSRLGILSETKEDEVINDAQIKILTGVTDKLSIREIYGKQKEFSPMFVPFISSNHRLKINLRDQAMYERLVLIPFRLSFLENPDPTKPEQKLADPHLPEKFEKNKQGILKWLVECSNYYYSNEKIDLPKVIVNAKLEYKKEMDDYANFVNIKIQESRDINDILTMGDILKSYKVYARDRNIVFDSKKAEKLLHDILQSYSLGHRRYSGLVLLEE